MRTDPSEPVLAELAQLAAEKTAITDNIWTEMIRVGRCGKRRSRNSPP